MDSVLSSMEKGCGNGTVSWFLGYWGGDLSEDVSIWDT